MTHPIPTQETSLVEQTALPKITVRGKSNEALIEAYVNAYVVGKEPELLTNGKRATPLYYLSLVAQHGQGTTLQAIFARLVNIHSHGAILDGIGEVFLAHHRQRIAACGYPIHWNFEQGEVQPERDLHAVIESNMLTICDPVRAMAVKSRKERTTTKRQHREKARASLSTIKGGKQADIQEVRHREQNPLFLMLVPSWYQETTVQQQMHFAFLDPRVPWPLDLSWSPFLWERGLEHNEIERLKTWSYTPPTSSVEEGLDDRLDGDET
ncbi:MAG: hypothetical protein H0V70_04455, partial [Ktedonobacteraceae bacterium]|nr:hypothetical protein [Ktedonobacteraceae bacterium]